MQVLYYQTVRPQSKVTRKPFTELEISWHCTSWWQQKSTHISVTLFPCAVEDTVQ